MIERRRSTDKISLLHIATSIITILVFVGGIGRLYSDLNSTLTEIATSQKFMIEEHKKDYELNVSQHRDMTSRTDKLEAQIDQLSTINNKLHRSNLSMSNQYGNR